MFEMHTDPDTGLHYIKRVQDEETKNHKAYNEDIQTTFMPEIKDNKMCPIQSYLTQLYSLSLDSDYLWQTPKFTKFTENPTVRT